MNINISYPKPFNDLWNKLKREYPEKIFDIEGVGIQLDFNHFSKSFFNNKTTTADISVDPSSNVADKSVSAFSLEAVKPLEKLDSYYVMWKYANEKYSSRVSNSMVESQLCGDIYINDLQGFASGKSYCYNFSAMNIATKGLPMVDKIKSSPPKYLLAFRSQIEQFVTIAANSTLGATGLADLLLVMSFYVEDILATKGDAHFNFKSVEDCWTYIEESLTSIIYTLNQPMRTIQSPFTNISIFDDNFLRKLADDYIHPSKGTKLNLKLVKKLQELYIKVMNQELSRTPITFPIVSACLSKDGQNNLKDEKFLDLISEKDLKFGFMNIFVGKSSTLSSCCRLRSDSNNEYFNSFGAGSSEIGSQGVVTINLARIGFKYRDNIPKILSEIKRLSQLCFKINLVRRGIIQKRIDSGHQPIYSLGFMNLNKQYLTLGFNGFYELLELTGIDPMSDAGVELGLNILRVMNLTITKLGKEHKLPVNMEQIPAENTSVKFATKDIELGINDGRYKIYSNQFVPLNLGVDLLEKLKYHSTFDSKCSGGAIFHANIETPIEDKAVAKDLIKTCAKTGAVYFAKNFNLQMCENDHVTVGKRKICPECKKPILKNFTRAVGFLTCVDNWSKERRELDYPQRKWY